MEVDNPMSMKTKPVTAFVLSLIAGILMLLGGFMAYWRIGWMGWWMHGMMGWYSWYPGAILYPFGIIGIVFGILVIVSSILLYTNPENHELFGILILIFSVASVPSYMGGMGLGLALGIIGGVLAIIWKPSETSTT